MIFGIYTNLGKDADFAITKRVIAALEARALPFYLDEDLKEPFGRQEQYAYIDDMEAAPDAVIVLGGDGTMLAAARKYAHRGAMLFGLNLGRLGFLLDAELEGLEAALDKIIAGDYHVQERLMVEAYVCGRDISPRFVGYALNEVVVSQRNMMRVVDLSVTVNDELASNVRADGMIVATPSGSTAYSLSAGGPVIMPTADVLLITPLCAHSLQSNSYVIDGGDEVKVRINSGMATPAITLDGQDYIAMEPEIM